MTPEIKEAFAKLRHIFKAKELLIRHTCRYPAGQTFDRAVEDFDRLDRPPPPDSEVLWEDDDNQQ